MPTPGEHKTVQAQILAYAEAIGWTLVSREEAEERRGLKERGLSSPRQIGERGGQECPPSVKAPLSLFFDDLLDAKVREFNPRYAEAEGALLGQFRHLHTDIYGNREFVEHLRNRGQILRPRGGWRVGVFFVFRDTMAAYVSQKGINATNPVFMCRINRICVIS